MKQLSLQIADETARQMEELAERWGLPKVRHNTPVIERCVERVWQAHSRPDYSLQLAAEDLEALQRLANRLPGQSTREIIAAALRQMEAKIGD